MNTPQPSHALTAERAHALEGRFAMRVALRLRQAADELPHDIAERLRFGRERALASARAAQRSAVEASFVVPSGAAAALGGPPSVWLRLGSLMPLIVLVVGLVLIQNHHDHEQIVTAAEVDAALLSDELPPAAYRDPGFTAFLQTQDTP